MDDWVTLYAERMSDYQPSRVVLWNKVTGHVVVRDQYDGRIVRVVYDELPSNAKPSSSIKELENNK